MKILCTADWHIGKKLEAFSRLEEQAEVLQQIVDISEAENADAVIVAGDCFDTQTPNPEMAKLFVKTLAKLARGGECLVLVISGNHDNPLFLSTSEAFASQVGVVIVGYPNETPQLESNHNAWQITHKNQGMIEIYFKKRKKTVRFLLAPYADARRLKRDLGTENTDLKAWEILCQNWERNISHEEDVVNILATHFFVQGEPKEGLYQDELLQEDEGERSIVGTIGAMNIKTIPVGIDYLILGHIHRPYSLYSSNNLKGFYTGSPLIYSEKESHQQKSVLILDLSKKRQEYRVDLQIKRNIVKIEFDNFETIYETLHRESENYVILIWKGDRYFSAEEHQNLRSTHPRILRIESLTTLDNNSQHITTLNTIHESSPEDLFKEYFIAKKGQQPAEDLIAIFQECLSEEKQESQLQRKQGFYPKKLKIQGFYSYKEEVEIDFSILDDKKFFGIFGNVGSGKSALIEAMIFALFGRVERLGAVSTSAGSFSVNYGMMNLESTKMLIEFSFEIIGENGLEEYKSLIYGERHKKKESDVSLKREYYCKKDGDWIAMEGDIKVLGESILGITYRDFCKTIVLQQRDFLGFLSEKPSETAETLMRLFQLERFDLADAEKRLSNELKNSLTILNTKLKDLTEVDPSLLTHYEHEFHQKKTESEVLDQELISKRDALQMLQKQNNQIQRYKEITQELAILDQQRERFEQARIRLDLQSLIDKAQYQKQLQQKITQNKGFIEERNSELRMLTQHKHQYTKEFDQLSQKFQNLSLSKEAKQSQKDELYNQAIMERVLALETKYNHLTTLNANTKSLNDKICVTKLLSDNLEIYIEQGKELRAKHQLMKENLDVSVGLAYLHEGLPCPLCGSKEHPNPCEPQDLEQLKFLEAQLDDVTKNYHESNQARKNYESYQQELEQLSKTIIGTLEGFSSQEDLERELLSLKEQKKQNDNLLEQLTKDLRVIDHELKDMLTQKDAISKNMQDVDLQIIKSNTEISNYTTSLGEYESEIHSLAQDLENTLKNMDITKDEFTEITMYPLESPQEINHYFSTISRLEGECNAINITDLKEVNHTQLKVLEDEVNAITSQLTNLQKNLGALEILVQQTEEKLKNKEILENEKNLLVIREENLKMLRSLFLGKGFVSFIAQKYLFKLCYTANHRFLKFTRNRFELAAPEDLNKGIYLIDRLSGGAKRDTRTLSGGQSFQAALSLALALADESGAGHRFFFVDEGFGSLDDENLLLVLETLRSLTHEEQRMVGLISHVPAIKEEVDICLNVIANATHGTQISWQ